MHGKARHLRLAHRHGEAAEAVGDVDPLHAEAAVRLLDDGERARRLERALDHQRGGFAGCIGVLLGRHRHGLGRRPRPGHRRVAAHEQVDADALAPADAVGRLDLDHVDAGIPGREGQGGGVLAAGDLLFRHRFVDHLCDVFRRPLAVVAGLQHRDPVALDQPCGERQPLARLSGAVDGDDLRRDRPGLLQVARHLHAEHEGRQRGDTGGGPHLDVVVGRHRRLDGVAARLRRRLDRRVKREPGRAARIGLGLALQYRCRAELGLAGETLVRREQEPVPAGRRPGLRELGDPPLDRALGHKPAGEIARHEIDRELAIKRHVLRRVEHGLEGRQPVGLLLERRLAAARGLDGVGLALLGVLALGLLRLRPVWLEPDVVVAGCRRLHVEAVIDTADLVRRHRDAPLLVARPGDHQRALAAAVAQRAALPQADHALDVDRFLGPVDRPLGEQVAEELVLLGAHRLRVDGPAEPGLLRLGPVFLGILRGAAIGLEHQRVGALDDDDAPQLRLGTGRQQPVEAAVRRRRATRQRHIAVALDALEPDLRAFHGPRRGQRRDDEAHPLRLLDGGERQIRHLQPHPAPLALVDRPQPDQIGPRLAGTGDAGQQRLQVQPELGVGTTALQRQRDELGNGGRAHRLDACRHGVAGDLVLAGPALRLVAGQYRRLVVVGRQPVGREGLEVARQRIDGMDADVGLGVATATQRHHLRPEPLDNALAGVPAQRRLVRREREALLEHLADQRPAARILDAAGRDAQRVDRVGQELAADPQPLTVALHRQVVDRRADAQRLARPDDVERLRLARKRQQERAPHRWRGGPVLRLEQLWRAAQDAVRDAALQLAAAGRVGDGERHGAAQPQLVMRLVQPGRVRKLEPQDRHAAVRHRLAQNHQIGLRIAAGGALQRLDGEVLGGQRLALPGNDARLRPDLDAEQARQHGRVDRLGEGQADLVQPGNAVGLVGRRAPGRHRQQRHQCGLAALGLDPHGLQRRPRVGRAELQRPRVEPLPGARLRRLQRHHTVRRVLGTTAGRAGVAIEEQRDRVPAAQEALGHHAGAVGALQPIETGRRRGGGGLRAGRQRSGRHEGGEGERRQPAPGEDPKGCRGHGGHRGLAGARPTRSR